MSSSIFLCSFPSYDFSRTETLFRTQTFNEEPRRKSDASRFQGHVSDSFSLRVVIFLPLSLTLSLSKALIPCELFSMSPFVSQIFCYPICSHPHGVCVSSSAHAKSQIYVPIVPIYVIYTRIFRIVMFRVMNFFSNLPPLSKSSFSLGSLRESGCEEEEVTNLGESWTIVAGLVSKIMVLSLTETVYLFADEEMSDVEEGGISGEEDAIDATLSPVVVATDMPLTSLRSPFTSSTTGSGTTESIIIEIGWEDRKK